MGLKKVRLTKKFTCDELNAALAAQHIPITVRAVRYHEDDIEIVFESDDEMEIQNAMEIIRPFLTYRQVGILPIKDEEAVSISVRPHEPEKLATDVT